MSGMRCLEVLDRETGIGKEGDTTEFPSIPVRARLLNFGIDDLGVLKGYLVFIGRFLDGGVIHEFSEATHCRCLWLACTSLTLAAVHSPSETVLRLGDVSLSTLCSGAMLCLGCTA